MKAFLRLLTLCILTVCIASLTLVFVSAESYELVPGSDRVIFLADLPADYTGAGTGNSPDDPFKPVPDPEGFDPTATNPKYHLTTGLYQAVEMLQKTGGTVVICGPVVLGEKQSTGNSVVMRDTFTPNFEKPIKFTSVYNGVDYRETNGARILITDGAGIGVNGESIWENLDIVTGSKTDRYICFNNYKAIVGEGMNCYPEDEAFTGVPQYYVSLVAGHRYNKLIGPAETHLIVRSGTYNKIVGGAWGGVTVVWNGTEADQEKFEKWKYSDINAFITVEGETRVLGAVCGTTNQLSAFGGNVYIDINGGVFEGDIYGGSSVSFINDNAQVNIKIKGGDFTNLLSIAPQDMNAKGYAPGVAILDATAVEFNEENWKSLTGLYSVISDFDEKYVMLPGWWSEKGPYAAETQAPETSAPETDAPDTEASSTEGTAVTEGPKSAEKTETEDNTALVPQKDDGSNVGLIIGIIAGVVVVAGIIAGVVIAKKKGGKKTDAE